MKSNKRKHLPKEFDDWFSMKAEYTNKKYPKYKALKKIVISDCDGVLTDSKSVYSKDGKFSKVYGAYDKEMMAFLRNNFGWKFIFVTDDKAGQEITFSRLMHLKKSFGEDLQFEAANQEERFQMVKSYLDDGHQVVFVGDSLSDIKSLNIATFAACPKNAFFEVKKFCDYVSDLNGADGAFADIIYKAHECLKHLK